MNSGGNWVNTNIFTCYKMSHGLSSEAQEGLERISMYTFRFYDDQGGVQIQRNIFGRIEKTWNIHNPELGSKETAVKYHGYILEKMAVNKTTTVEEYLDRLANS
ncbi:hypothetical protein KDW_20500 [Dictyobacter vulcani]|uniref:Uncharacterized protein n=1 Tax=Dictyobacter vulcani TaxID=2607529 RepID=A0A5J4KEX9_9CHLR|nr:hypothetical protein KDW_20500 [Dictyobacter vulcani]